MSSMTPADRYANNRHMNQLNQWGQGLNLGLHDLEFDEESQLWRFTAEKELAIRQYGASRLAPIPRPVRNALEHFQIDLSAPMPEPAAAPSPAPELPNEDPPPSESEGEPQAGAVE
jgi:hypothetical protein